jgi:hypothetical protein
MIIHPISASTARTAAVCRCFRKIRGVFFAEEISFAVVVDVCFEWSVEKSSLNVRQVCRSPPDPDVSYEGKIVEMDCR